MKTKKVKQPAWMQPMLSTLVKEPFSDKDWIFEKKFDGFRCLVFRNGERVILYSRNQLSFDYPEIREAFRKQKCQSFIVDGEIVAHKGNLESFSVLQTRMSCRNEKDAKKRGIKVSFYVFDILYYDGYDLRKLPLLERKKILAKALSFKAPIFYTEHVVEKGEKLFQNALKKGWEGVMAKKAISTYQGKRSLNWKKFKAFRAQEFIICGYTLPHGSRNGFGALLIGYYEKGKLLFAGKVGTGYSEQTLDQLSRKLKNLSIQKSPFTENLVMKDAFWVRPTLVAQVGFTEWTKDHKLRHPRFLGLRTDKSAKEVIREKAK